jgi:hypothetical protein
MVDSKFTKIAAEALLDSSPAYLVNHAMRTFFFGALIGRQEKKYFDGEVFFLACALHDLGLQNIRALCLSRFKVRKRLAGFCRLLDWQTRKRR